MAIDPAQIELTPEQKERLAALAERTGRPYADIVDDWLSNVSLPEEDGVHQSEKSSQTAYEAFAALGAIGCFGGPSDLSTNPKYLEGFGADAKSPHSD